MPQDKIMKMFSFLNKFNTEFSNKKEWDQNAIIKHGKNTIRWYTIGSKIKDETGI